MEWLYKGRVFVPPENFSSDDYYGFVYEITNRCNGKKYIGKKFFWSQKTLAKTKTRKRRKKILIESDLRNYFGSNKILSEEVKTQGESIFHRNILHLCNTKGECAYLEAKEQFDKEVLMSDKYYNGIINVRLGGNAVKGLK